MFHYKEYIPGLPLRNYIKLYYVLEHGSPYAYNPTFQRVTPDGCFELNFPLEAPIIRKDTAGNRQANIPYLNTRLDGHYFVKRTGLTRIAGVRFFPWGLHAFTRCHTQNTPYVEADNLFGSSIHGLHERLYYAKTDAGIVQLLEHHFVTRLRGDRRLALVQAACKKIALARGDIQLKAMAGEMGLTLRRLQQVFEQVTGTNPKQIARIIRFRQAVHLLTHNQFGKLSDVAYDSNYTDQSHFIREFSQFAGLSPREYYCEQHPLDDLSSTSSLFME